MNAMRVFWSFFVVISCSAWLKALPIVYLIHQSEAIGESLRLLSGAGNSRRHFAERELNSARVARLSQK